MLAHFLLTLDINICIIKIERSVILMNERIKELRKSLNLTQQEFADRIGIKRNSLANYETGRNVPIDAIVVSICREFDVSEEWLRNGLGSMQIVADRHTEIAKLTKQLLREEEDSFKNRLISAITKLTPEQWELLEQIAENISNK